MKHLLLFLLLTPLFSLSQGSMQLDDKPFTVKQVRKNSIDSFLASFKSFQNYSSEEQAFFYWVNFLRSNPQAFKEQVIEPFLSEFPEANSAYSKSLLADLEQQEALPYVEPNSLLSKTCSDHARDLVRKQQGISHTSSDGRSFQQRMEDAGVTKCAGENILEGDRDPLKAVIMLLIDQGVPAKGHRRALLNPSFDLMGCAIIPKTNSENYILVQLFSCK